jgi:hypothetical protein
MTLLKPHTEMSMLRNMGVNAVRQNIQYVPPQWIQYIYEKHGIYTMLIVHLEDTPNVGGKWIPNTEYSDSKTEALIISESGFNGPRKYPGLCCFY